jgi:opacity protein-like surface antigen
MKKILFFCLSLVLLSAGAYADPILTEPVKGVAANNLEVGLGISYGMDTWEWDNNITGDNSLSLTVIQAMFKYGLNDKLQLNLDLPYRSWKSELEVNGATSSTDDSGISQIGIGAKYSINDMLAAGLDIQLPTGDVDKSLGEGTNVGLLLACRHEFKPVIISGNIGYRMKSEYEDEHDVKHDPADPLIIRAAVEYTINEFSPFAEIQAQFFGKSKTAGIDITESDGSTIDLMIGSQYTMDNLKAKLGFGFAGGDEDLRIGRMQFYDSADWKIVATVSYTFDLKGGSK